MAEYEYTTEDQFNVGFSETLSMSVNAPAIAKRIFDTYEHAMMFVNNKRDTAVAGLILSVFKDNTNTYKLIDSNVDEDTKKRIGYDQVDKLPTENLDNFPKNIIISNGDGKTFSTYKKVPAEKNGIYQVIEDPTNPENGLNLKKVGINELGDGLEKDDLDRPKVKIEPSILSTTDEKGNLIQNEMLTVSEQGLRFNIVTDMGLYSPESLTANITNPTYVKDSFQLFRNEKPFLPDESKNLTALQNAKTILNGIFSTTYMESVQGNPVQAKIRESNYAFKNGETIAVYYKEADGIVRASLAIVYINFENKSNPISLSWFSNDDEEEEIIVYKGGDGINLNEETHTFSTDSSIIKLGDMTNEEDLKGNIKVTNPIGNFKLKEEVSIDTAVKRIIKDMLTKLEDVDKVLPSTSFNYYSKEPHNVYKEGSYEVGSTFSGTLEYKYPIENQGKFTGWWLNEPTGEQNAECAKNDFSKYTFGGNLTQEVKTPITESVLYEFVIDEGNATISLDLNYDASPHNDTITQNDGKTAIVNKILAGSIPTITKTYTGQYNYFIGTFKQVNVGEKVITDASQFSQLSNISKGFCTINGTTKISKFGSTSDTPTIVLIVPSKYDNITRTCNDFSQEIDLNLNNPWVKQEGTISYTNGTKTTEYTIYIQYLTDGTIYRNIEFGVRK